MLPSPREYGEWKRRGDSNPPPADYGNAAIDRLEITLRAARGLAKDVEDDLAENGAYSSATASLIARLDAALALLQLPPFRDI